MHRVFEYNAMRLKADSIMTEVLNQSFENLCDTLVGRGLGCIEAANGAVVVYPMQSPRKNPAVVVIDKMDMNGMSGWSALKSIGGYRCYVYEAGAFDLARGCPKSKVRAEAENTALHK